MDKINRLPIIEEEEEYYNIGTFRIVKIDNDTMKIIASNMSGKDNLRIIPETSNSVKVEAYGRERRNHEKI